MSSIDTVPASSVASSSTDVNSGDLPRSEAGPLPSKRGEIGYSDELHGEAATSRDDVSSVAPMPERHPADRDAPPSTESVGPAAAPTTTPTATVAAEMPNGSATPPETGSMHSTSKRSLKSFFHPKNVPLYFGIRLTTLVLFVCQLLGLAGTIAGWVVSAMMLSNAARRQSSNDNQAFGAASSTIFVHVLFALILIVQMIFLERRIFRVRAERWMFVHPGEMLPTSRRRRPTSTGSTTMGFAPWHRPPLPTYARALQDSGWGTGDVEDNVIAAPPPPAYGNTRGSTMLLTGFLRNSLRLQRPASEHSQRSQMAQVEEGERPVSYMSRDEQWEEVMDAHRAEELEQTLAQLERPAARGTSPPSARS